MKFFKKSKIDIINKDKNKENFLEKFKEYFLERKNFNLFYVSNNSLTFYNEDFIIEKLYYANKYELMTYSSNIPLINKNIFKNKIINYTLYRGQKLTSYKIYNDTFKLFFSFFNNFNSELKLNYDLYETYYEYSLKNPIIFFEPIFIYHNLISFLQPSFIISLKKHLKTKKNKKQAKEIVVSYIKPNSRFYFCLKSIIRFSKTFGFKKCHENIAYSLLNLFLLNKNSIMYKKKILAYERLIKLRKTK